MDLDRLPIPESQLDSQESAEGSPTETAQGDFESKDARVEPVPSAGGLPILVAKVPLLRPVEPERLSAPLKPPSSETEVVLADSARKARATAETEANQEMVPASDERPAVPAPVDPPHKVGLLRTSLSLAYVLAFTCLLPDLSAVFQAAGGRKRARLRPWVFRRGLFGRRFR